MVSHLIDNEPSLAVSTGQTLAKALLLAGASELEMDTTRIVLEFFEDVSAGNMPAVRFVENKALKRQYHALFDWDRGNANSFFGLFGPDLKQYVSHLVSQNVTLSQGIAGFLRLGSLRNQLVHGNFASFSLSLTVEEIYALYQQACDFRDALPGILRQSSVPVTHEAP